MLLNRKAEVSGFLILFTFCLSVGFSGCIEKSSLTPSPDQTIETNVQSDVKRGEVLLGEKEFPITTRDVEEEEPSMAWDGTHYLVVWQDKRSGSFDIYGSRITPSGKNLDPQGFPISRAPSDQIKPKVIWNGNNYFIVWQDKRNGQVWEIFGARVNPTGKVLDENGIPISVGNDFRATPSLSWDGRNVLVVWEEKGDPSRGWDILGARVDSFGKVLDPAGIPIARESGDQYYSGISWNGENYWVVWSDQRNGSDFDIFGARVNPDGEVLDPGGIQISKAANNQYYPSIGWNGQFHLVAWMDKRKGESGIYGARLTSGGKVMDPDGIPIDESPNFHALPFVTSRGSEFMVIWDEEGKVTFKDIYGTRMDSNGNILDPGFIEIYKGFERQSHSVSATDGKRYLVVWKDYRAGIPFQGDIYGRFIDFSTDGIKHSELKPLPSEPRLGPYLIHQISIDSRNPEILYAATSHYGILKSEDAGMNWKLMNQGLKSYTHHQIIIHPHHPNILYAGAWGGGVSKSWDGGASWQEMNTGLGNTAVNQLVFHPNNPEEIYAVSESGIFRSYNGGEHWEGFNNGLTLEYSESLQTLFFLPSQPVSLFMGSTKALYFWGQKLKGWAVLRKRKGEEYTVLAGSVDGKVLLVGTRGSGLLKSKDEGKNWVSLDELNSSWITDMVFDPTDVKIFYVATTDQGVIKTTDGGRSWKKHNQGLPDQNIRTIEIHPYHPEILYAGTYEDGIYISKNGGKNWEPAHSIPELTMTEILGSLSLDEDVRSPGDIQRLIDKGVAVGNVFGLGSAGEVPQEFVKCNGCHGWTEPLLNLRKTYWRVPPNTRDWRFTVKDRMSKRANLTPNEEETIIQFLEGFSGGAFQSPSLSPKTTPEGTFFLPKRSQEVPEKVVQRVCSQCHALEISGRCVAGDCQGKKVHQTGGRQWDFVVDWMKAMGAPMNDHEQQVVTEYLMDQFPGKLYRLNWEKVTTLPGHGWNITMLGSLGEYIFAGTEGNGKIFGSVDGKDWHEVHDSGEYRIYGMIPFQGAFYTGSDEPRAEIWKSQDGNHWEKSAVLPKDQTGIISLGVFKDHLFAGTSHGKLFRSVDGEQWEEAAVFKQLDGPHWVRFIIEFKGMLYAGAEHGYLYRSADGLQWTEIGKVLRGEREFFGIRAAQVFNDGLYVGSITHGEIWKTQDGENWTVSFDATPGKDGGYVGSMVIYNDSLYAGIRTYSGFIFGSSDGVHWEEVGNISPHTIEAMTVYKGHLYAGTLIPPKAMIYRGTEKTL